jgi:DNA-binding Xre family transcriptional regulator
MIHCTLRLVMAQENASRARQNLPTLTQSALASSTGIPPSVISNLYHDKIRRVDYGTLDKLCMFFNVQPNSLLIWKASEEH